MSGKNRGRPRKEVPEPSLDRVVRVHGRPADVRVIDKSRYLWEDFELTPNIETGLYDFQALLSSVQACASTVFKDLFDCSSLRVPSADGFNPAIKSSEDLTKKLRAHTKSAPYQLMLLLKQPEVIDIPAAPANKAAKRAAAVSKPVPALPADALHPLGGTAAKKLSWAEQELDRIDSTTIEAYIKQILVYYPVLSLPQHKHRAFKWAGVYVSSPNGRDKEGCAFNPKVPPASQQTFISELENLNRKMLAEKAKGQVDVPRKVPVGSTPRLAIQARVQNGNVWAKRPGHEFTVQRASEITNTPTEYQPVQGPIGPSFIHTHVVRPGTVYYPNPDNTEWVLVGGDAIFAMKRLKVSGHSIWYIEFEDENGFRGVIPEKKVRPVDGFEWPAERDGPFVPAGLKFSPEKKKLRINPSSSVTFSGSHSNLDTAGRDAAIELDTATHAPRDSDLGIGDGDSDTQAPQASGDSGAVVLDSDEPMLDDC